MQKLRPIFLLFFILFVANNLSAQKLIVVNGGLLVFGGTSTDYANIGIYDFDADTYETMDTIYTNSIQDAFIEDNQYLYVAAQDSIVKYDLTTKTRLAAAEFGGTSTIKMAIYNDKLLVGNWYGSSDNNFRIFDKNTLAYTDSIPEIVYGAKDFVVLNDTAYIAQNLTSSSFSDSLGFMSIVDLNTMTWVRNDTIHDNAEPFGRMTVVGDSTIYALSSSADVIANYSAQTGQSSVNTSPGVDISMYGYGPSIYQKGNEWFFACNGTDICGYDLINGTTSANTLTNVEGSASTFTFAMDTVNSRFYVARIHYGNNVADRGIVYDMAGDSIGNFQTGFYPEALVMWYDNVSTSIEETPAVAQLTNFEIYPNPAVDYLRLSFATTEQRQVFISNTQGQLIYHSNSTSNQFELDVRALTAGFYQVSVMDGKGNVETQQFVKY
ncbi:MAG: T9SS type A sorting domain-containing protein [Saprospiraceae bacterium]|nr:T9SS type A sorting domain-containing protein [Saprospiraceae bacterium]